MIRVDLCWFLHSGNFLIVSWWFHSSPMVSFPVWILLMLTAWEPDSLWQPANTTSPLSTPFVRLAFDTPPDPDFAVRLRNRVKSLKIDQPDQLTKDGGHRWKFTWGVAENSLLSSYDASKWITMVWNQSGESFWIILHLVSCLYVEFKVSFGRELTSFLSYVLICLHSGVLLAVIFWQLRWVPTIWSHGYIYLKLWVTIIMQHLLYDSMYVCCSYTFYSLTLFSRRIDYTNWPEPFSSVEWCNLRSCIRPSLACLLTAWLCYCCSDSVRTLRWLSRSLFLSIDQFPEYCPISYVLFHHFLIIQWGHSNPDLSNTDATLIRTISPETNPHNAFLTL